MAMCIYEDEVSNIEVIVNGYSVQALFNTGSDVSITLIGNPKLVNMKRILTIWSQWSRNIDARVFCVFGKNSK